MTCKEKLIRYLSMWQSGDTDALEDIFNPSVRAYFNVAKAGGDGGQHSVYGVRDFLLDFPRTQDMTVTLCDLKSDAQGGACRQYAMASICGTPSEEEMFRCLAFLSLKWKLEEESWKIRDMRTDIWQVSAVPSMHLRRVWVMDSSKGGCILPELDSPWRFAPPIPAENEEMQIRDCLCKLNFSSCYLWAEGLLESVSDRWPEDKKLDFVNERLSRNQEMTWRAWRLEGETKGDKNTRVGQVVNVAEPSEKMEITFCKESRSWRIMEIT